MKYFHGIKGKKGVFEGWYFKHQKEDKTLAFIPSVIVDKKGNKKAVLQIVTQDRSWTIEESIQEFSAEGNQLSIRIAKNYFNERGCVLNIDTDDLKVQGKISYDDLLKPQTDIMGPLRFIPNLVCNHGIVSLYHCCHGSVTINDESYDMEMAHGYIEMDWGSGFPKKYVWAHAGWMEYEPVCVVSAIAKIKILGIPIWGCFGYVLQGYQGTKIATYLGAKVIKIAENELLIKQNDLSISMKRLSDKKVELDAPCSGEFSLKTSENVSCEVEIIVTDKQKELIHRIIKFGSFETML